MLRVGESGTSGFPGETPKFATPRWMFFIIFPPFREPDVGGPISGPFALPRGDGFNHPPGPFYVPRFPRTPGFEETSPFFFSLRGKPPNRGFLDGAPGNPLDRPFFWWQPPRGERAFLSKPAGRKKGGFRPPSGALF